MEPWILEYKKKLRKELGAGIEIKMLGGSPYVYRSTTYWDKVEKRRKKRSKYLGSLDKKKGFIRSSGKVLTRFSPRTIKKYGNAELVHKAAEDLIPLLKEYFPLLWQEMYALLVVRLLKHAPIKRVSSVWETLHNKLNIHPKLSPKIVSSIFREIGANRESQNKLFRRLVGGKGVFAYDMSVIFSQSEGINFAEKGRNRFHLHLPQINLVLLTSIKDEMPAAIKIVPGSVRDISSLYVTLEEIPLENIILILDTGFFSVKLMKKLKGMTIQYIIPTKRNSLLYEERTYLRHHFFYKKRLIKAGKKRMDDNFIYLFEDSVLKMEEENTFYEKIDKEQKKKSDLKSSKFGKILIVSNLDKKPEEIFLLYKQRDEVEKSFDAFKNVLESDRLYLQDTESAFGHIFISFLALYAYSRIRAMLKKADLLKKYSVEDVLEEFAKVYLIKDEDREIISDVTKKVRKLDEAMGTDLFPKKQS